jgi:superfamily II DNA or RNA helicase
MFEVGLWVWSSAHRQAAKIIDSSSLWGKSYSRLWLPQNDLVVRVSNEYLSALNEATITTPGQISYISTAARIVASQSEDVLLAPIGSNVIPLPHQLKALNKAISKTQVRYLLADEVGLGKTIEAGLVMRELKLRGLVRRILVVAPKGIITQWVSEMQVHFNERFKLLIPGQFNDSAENVWEMHDQVICPMDSIKPIEKRKGWNLDKINQYNKQRFDDIISAGWDLIIVDEAHRLQGSTESVARYKLGQGLADAAPYFLLLSATPHQGKSDGFQRLMSLLDHDIFPDEASVTQERVKPYVIRTEKRQAIDAEGKPLFQPRQTQLVSVAWSADHAQQRDLYDAVTEYVREGYNQALATKQNAIGFLMILMQRLVVSSPAAIKATLVRRLEVLNKPAIVTQTMLLTDEEWEDLDGQQQVDELLNTRVKALKNEKEQVQWLLDLAEQCVQLGVDAKADALLEWVTRLQREENDPNLKVLIFTEFVSTQTMLAEFFSSRGMSMVTLNGSLSMEEREYVQQKFAKDTRILISTDAGGEGLNLQFCHVIINYDIPWNPMRLEQRIGRVDRIGQKKIVRALNLVFEDTVEHRVREVLEEKLMIILEEFGVDKTGDVLDSAQVGHLFDGLYTGALQHPDNIDQEIDKALQELKQQARNSQSSKYLFTDDTPIDAELAETLKQHPLPYWLERMTLNYLSQAEGASIEKRDNSWQLNWPDGDCWENCIFSNSQAEEDQRGQHITLDHPKIRGLIQNIPSWVPGCRIPHVSVPTIPHSVNGIWSLWQITLGSNRTYDRYQSVDFKVFFPVYYTCDAKVFPATAKRIWEALLSNDVVIHQNHSLEDNQISLDSETIFEEARHHAEDVGVVLFNDLKQKYSESLEIIKEKTEYGFSVRRRAIARIGLPEVKKYRQIKLEQEIEEWKKSFEESKQITPELSALLVLSMVPNNG